MDGLSLNFQLPVKAFNGGKFVSCGEGIHPTRVIDFYEIIYVTEGILDMFENEKTLSVPAGSALLLFPGRQHGGRRLYPENLSFYWIHFDLETKQKKSQVLEIPQQVLIQRPMQMTELFRRFLDDQESGQQNSLQASLLVMQMLTEMSVTGSEVPDASVRLVEQAVKYIKLHLKEVKGTAEIATALKCNPDYLGRKFKEKFGWTLTDEIHRQRIHQAKRLLLDSVMNIAEIAAESGFEDPVYFRKIFKRIVGTSPSAYRQQYSRIYINTEYRW